MYLLSLNSYNLQPTFALYQRTKTMRSYVVVSILFIFLLLLGCNKDNDDQVGISTLNVEVLFYYGDEEFEINELYSYDSLDYVLKIENLKMYLANLQLVDADGVSHLLSEVSFVNAADSVNRFSFSIPAVQYTELLYAVGVPISLNGTADASFDAALYDPDHALSLSNGMYWTWNTGYRFVLIDGRCNTNPTVDDDFETLVSIHTGKDYCYRSSSKDMSFVAMEEGISTITLTVDVEAFFSSDSDLIDLAVDNQSHGTNESLANRVSDNVIKALDFEMK